MIVGITLVKDEADILPATLAQMLSQVDHVIVADNASTDGTRDYLASLDDERLTVLDEPRIGYYQSERMSELAAKAAAMGAEFVVPWDADEFWYSPFGRIADVLSEHPGAVATAAIFDHVPTARDDESEPDPVKRIGWRRHEPCPLHKVACRPTLPVTIEQGNHGASYPTQKPLDGQLVIRHFAHRSVEQLVRKVRNGAAAYAATDLPPEQGQHWREWGKLLDERGEEAIAELFHTWYFRERPEESIAVGGELQPPLIFDPAPCASQS